MSVERMEKPTIYLPVEIKAREFKAKVLLATVAAHQGFRVYLGSKAAIDRLVREKTKPNGIYFYKGGKPKKFLIWLKQRTEYFVVLDEEMGPAVQDLDYHYKRRIYPGTEDYVDRLYVVSDLHREIIAKIRPPLLERVEVTGWPRVDLWRPDFKASYGNEIRALQARFGEFLLFSSDFGMLSEQAISHELARMREMQFSPEEYDHHRCAMHAAYADFLAFVELVKCIDADPEFPKLIIRPHPSEDICHWQQQLAGLQRVKIIFEGEISSWLYASRGLLHRGCTTAVQAYVGGTPVLYWVGGQSRVKHDTLSYQVSRAVGDYSALKHACNDIVNCQYQAPTSIDLQSKLYIDDQQLACDKIVASLQRIAATVEPPFRLPPWRYKWRQAWGWLAEYRVTRNWGRDQQKLARVRRKMAGGIHQAEVAEVAARLVPDFSGTIIECDYNVVEVEA